MGGDDGKIREIFRPLKRALRGDLDLIPQACAGGYRLLPAKAGCGRVVGSASPRITKSVDQEVSESSGCR